MTLQQFIDQLVALAEEENAYDCPIYFRVQVDKQVDLSIHAPVVTMEKRIVRGEYAAKIKVRNV